MRGTTRAERRGGIVSARERAGSAPGRNGVFGARERREGGNHIWVDGVRDRNPITNHRLRARDLCLMNRPNLARPAAATPPDLCSAPARSALAPINSSGCLISPGGLSLVLHDLSQGSVMCGSAVDISRVAGCLVTARHMSKVP